MVTSLDILPLITGREEFRGRVTRLITLMGKVYTSYDILSTHQDALIRFNADFFYNSTADEIIFKRIKPIIKNFELTLNSVKSLSSDSRQREKNNYFAAGPNIFKPLLHKSIIARKPTIAQQSDQDVQNKYLNKTQLSSTYLPPSIFNLHLDLNKTEPQETEQHPISDSYLPPPKISSLVLEERDKIVSFSNSYLPPPKTSNIDLSLLAPTAAQSTNTRGNSKKTKETLINTIPYSYIAPIKSTIPPLKSGIKLPPKKDKVKPEKKKVPQTQYFASSYLPPVVALSQDLIQVFILVAAQSKYN